MLDQLSGKPWGGPWDKRMGKMMEKTWVEKLGWNSAELRVAMKDLWWEWWLGWPSDVWWAKMMDERWGHS